MYMATTHLMRPLTLWAPKHSEFRSLSKTTAATHYTTSSRSPQIGWKFKILEGKKIRTHLYKGRMTESVVWKEVFSSLVSLSRKSYESSSHFWLYGLAWAHSLADRKAGQTIGRIGVMGNATERELFTWQYYLCVKWAFVVSMSAGGVQQPWFDTASLTPQYGCQAAERAGGSEHTAANKNKSEASVWFGLIILRNRISFS